jgi:hypothetical protein
MPRRIWVVINRVWSRVIVVNRARLIHDNALGFIVRHVNDIFFNRCDLNNAIFLHNGLVAVTLEVSSRIGAIAETLDRGDDGRLLSYHRLSKTPGPVEIVGHHLDNFRIVA